MRCVFWAMLTATLSLAACVAPRQSESITKIESRTSHPHAVARLVMSQVADILIFDQPRLSLNHPPARPLSEAWFFTRPRAAETPGLCVSTQVLVAFEPSVDADRGAETQVRASDVQTTPLFHFLTPPQPSTPPAQPEDDAREDAACRSLDPRDLSFFEADDAYTARSASILMDLIRREPDSVEVDCQVRGSVDSCRSDLSDTLSAPVTFMRRCDHDGSGECFYVQAGDHALTIVGSNVYRPTEGLHWEVRGVRVNDLIILVHSRPD